MTNITLPSNPELMYFPSPLEAGPFQPKNADFPFLSRIPLTIRELAESSLSLSGKLLQGANLTNHYRHPAKE